MLAIVTYKKNQERKEIPSNSEYICKIVSWKTHAHSRYISTHLVFLRLLEPYHSDDL